MNRITIKEIESVIKNIPTKKSPRPDGLNDESYQTLKELMPFFLRVFQKTEEEGMLPNSFYEASITLMWKADKDTTRKLQSNIPDEYRCKNY